MPVQPPVHQPNLRVFRALLALYPGDFRAEYGREIALVFTDRYRNAANRMERTAVWVEVIFGVLTEAPREHCHMFIRDIRYAVRMLRNNPVFATTVVLALALGIGANTAVFSILNTVAWRTLPVEEPQQLYRLRQQSRNSGALLVSWPEFEGLRQGSSESGKIAAMSRALALVHAGAGRFAQSEMVGLQLVSGEFFGVLGVSAELGRLLTPEDNRIAGQHRVAVISHGCWQRRFGSSPDVIGQEIALNGQRFTIIGVASRGFSGLWLETPTEVWLPIAMQHEIRAPLPYSSDGANATKPWMPQERIRWLHVIMRAPAGAKAATAGLDRVFQQQLAQRAESIGNAEERRFFLERRLAADPFGSGLSAVRQTFLSPLYALMALAALVLLIACANTANLLLARASGRQREMAMRMSLGAGRGTLVRQLLTENLLLVSTASVTAVLIGYWTANALVRMATPSAPGVAPFTVHVDGAVLAFTAGLAIFAALFFGMIPAFKVTRVELIEALKAGARNISGGGGRTPRLLVVLQVAISLVLVVATGLLVRSLQNVLSVQLGFAREHVLSVTIDSRMAGYTEPAQLHGLVDRLLERVASMPGVRSAAVASCGIMTGCRNAEDGLKVEGYESRPGEQVLVVNHVVTPGYFEAVGMRLLAGRGLDDRDRQSSPLVAVVNESFVRRYFGGAQPIGKRFGSKLNQQIVGVVENARLLNVKEDPEPMAFFPLKQRPSQVRSIDIRAAGDPRHIASAIRQAIAETAPDLPIESVATLSERVSNNLGLERLLISLSAVFGVLALGLAGLGLFGLLSYAVARRTADFGIRIALGAPQRVVLWGVFRESLLLSLTGVAIGLLMVLAGSGLIRAVLFEVNPLDAPTIAMAIGVLLVVAGLAGLLPSWRASRVDPLVAIRLES